MGTTACWGTNESFDCEWISFGYGSRNDTSQLWLSLDAYLALSRLDDLPMGDYIENSTIEEFQKYSPFRAYTFSSDQFVYADIDKALNWFEKARKSRQYYIKNPEKIEEKKKDEAIRNRVYEMHSRSNGYTVAYFSLRDSSYQEYVSNISNTDFEELIDSLKKKHKQQAQEKKLYLSGYDGVIGNYEYIKKLHETSEYQKRDVYTMGGISYHKGWLEQCNQGPINWMGGESPERPLYVDSNPNRLSNIKDPEMINQSNFLLRLKADEWENLNNWKGP